MNLKQNFKRTAAALGLTAVAWSGVGAAQAEDVINFGSATTSVIVAPFLLATVEPEIFGKHDLKLEVTYFQGKSANCVAALIGGSIDMCAVGTTTGTDAIAEGAQIKAGAFFAGPINEVILSKKTVDKLGVSPEAPVDERIKAMNGLRIISAAPGSAHWTTLNMMLQRVGLSVKDLQYQVLGDTLAMMEAIRNDQVDGALWSAGSLGNLLATGEGVRWISVPRGDLPEQLALPYNTVFVNNAWAEKNPDVLKRFQAALGDAIKIVKDDPEGSSKKIKAAFAPDMDQTIWDEGFEAVLPALYDGGKAPRSGWEAWLRLQAENTGKDYAPAAFDIAVDEGARAD
jgi:ABC-type nitrate/sulfonate/bicarbonate transport system substrate-binding protein